MDIHPDLLSAQELFYKPNGFVLQNLKLENESSDYGAAEFTIANLRIKFRAAKITPTKTGQFVTFWKRVGKGPILPYDLNDPFDLLVVSVRSTNRFGQFVFPKSVLCEKGLVSKEKVGGKRAMRVYPPWDKVDSSQAKKTQAWQMQYFFEIPAKEGILLYGIQDPCLLKRVEQQEIDCKKFGFYWENFHQLIEQIQSECVEIQEAWDKDNFEHLQEEIGDLIQASISLAVFCKLDPHETLQKSIDKFQQRYDAVVQMAKRDGYENLHQQSFELLMDYWRRAKLQTKSKV